MHGVQLWVNLPRERKMMAPRYQDIPAGTIPVAPIEGGTVRVISGAYGGTEAVIDTIVPIRYLHVRLDANGTFSDVSPQGHNGFVFLLSGSASLDGLEVTAHHLVRVEGAYQLNARTDTEFLVLSGPPLGEPVARYGPFVMNTRAEIHQALQDYHDGKFGTIPPELGGSKPYLPGEETP